MTLARQDKFGEHGGILALDWRSGPPDWAQRGVVAVGNFDGVHCGHQALVHQARNLAGSLNARLTILGFDPHPLQLLAPEKFQPPLTTIDERAALLRAAGADGVVILQTDLDLLNLAPEAFFDQILVQRFRLKGLVEGFNFRFGHDRAGSVNTLRALCGEIGVVLQVVKPFQLDDVIVSSSRVRDALTAGDVGHAARLLNRCYRLRGTVVAGARRGRTIGFPTANLDDVHTLLPADGVYAARVCDNDSAWPAALNIGPNPTFGEGARKIEAHLIGFAGDLYGRSLTVEFVERLRGTRRFSDAADLVEQLRQDVERARKLVV
jgi:riboflavin kinase / FMN adenylyltransferase